ncbi:MAG TPA: alpha/beta fold hydrolase [Chitinophagaceae bacterium]|nr:alpha/beta fold hydrolase [Chitinophagaceae bacterium]
MEPFYLSHSKGRFHGITAGNGPLLLICLHGFGESCHSFECLETSFAKGYTLVSIDLPGHGETGWPGRYFRPEELKEMLVLVLERFGKGKCILLGYSMGSRLALCAMQLMPSGISALVLLAPDGLRTNFWHSLATRTWLGNRIFHHFINHSGQFFGLMRTGRFLGLVNRGVFKFASQKMESREKRQQVYRIWTSMKEMNPSVSKVRKILLENHIPLLLIFGKYDQVIPPSWGRRFFGDQPLCEMIVLDRGHQMLNAETAILIRQSLDKLIGV